MASNSPTQQPSTRNATMQLMSYYNGALMSLMINIGARLKIFEIAGNGTYTCEELATKAHVNSRYLREWLGAMTCAGIFQYNPERKTYSLGEEWVAALCGSTGISLLASSYQITCFAPLIDNYVECFQDGGGVPFEVFKGVQTMMGDFTSIQMRRFLVKEYLPKTDHIYRKLSEGTPCQVLEIGCGVGNALCLMNQAFPHSQFFGLDIDPISVQEARKNAESKKCPNITFVAGDAAKIDQSFPNRQFDLIVALDVVHDSKDPQGVLDSVFSHLVDDGVFLMLDVRASSNLEDNIQLPSAQMMYSMSTLFCMTTSLAQGGAGLGTMWGEQLAQEMLKKAGFSRVAVTPASDKINNLYVAMKGAVSRL